MGVFKLSNKPLMSTINLARCILTSLKVYKEMNGKYVAEGLTNCLSSQSSDRVKFMIFCTIYMHNTFTVHHCISSRL